LYNGDDLLKIGASGQVIIIPFIRVVTWFIFEKIK